MEKITPDVITGHSHFMVDTGSKLGSRVVVFFGLQSFY